MFLLQQLHYRSTPKLELWYGTVGVILFFYSLVTNQVTTCKSQQNKIICSLRFMDHIRYVFPT